MMWLFGALAFVYAVIAVHLCWRTMPILKARPTRWHAFWLWFIVCALALFIAAVLEMAGGGQIGTWLLFASHGSLAIGLGGLCLEAERLRERMSCPVAGEVK